MRALASGQSVALMNDQKFNQGIAVPFFGHDAMTAPGPTRLAMKYNVPLQPMSTLRTGPARYKVTVYEPFMPDADPDEHKAIYNTVLRINQFVEDRIREAPDQWFWQAPPLAEGRMGQGRCDVKSRAQPMIPTLSSIVRRTAPT